MDVRYINPFIEAVKHIFKTMLATDILVSKPTLKDRSSPASDVSAIIGFTGNANGSVSVCFSKQVAVRVGSKLAGMELSIYEPEMLADALGELTQVTELLSKNGLGGIARAVF